MRPPPRAVLCFFLLPRPLPVLVLWLPNISTARTHKHTHTRVHARTDPDAVHSTRNEDKRLEFRVWHQTFSPPHVGQPLPPFCFHSFFSSLPHRSVLFLEPKQQQEKKKKKESGRKPLRLFFLSGNKNKLKWKKNSSFFFIFLFFQIQGTMSINIPICLSPLQGTVCEHRVT